jgi:TBC1 domain family member 13
LDHSTQTNFPNIYQFPLLLLLLTQEFELVDVLRIWDSLLCPENKLDFLYFLCVAITIILKPELMNEDFAVCLQRLQRIGNLSVKEIIDEAWKLFKNKTIAQKFLAT